MIELVQNRAEPNELIEYRQNCHADFWDDPAFLQIKKTIKRSLYKEQEGLCVYCECRLKEEESHIEHIKSRSKKPDLTFSYQNLAQSCNAKSHCGHHKGDKLLPIEPYSGCNSFFDISARDGTIIPALSPDNSHRQKTIDTLKILGLNDPALKRDRQHFIKNIQNKMRISPEKSKEEILSKIPYKWILGRLLF
ncbi:MAG: TIGR02646 family protein [Firmicutes bacterium]|nr:TIGR02646 family protein [Bacillota bacterium]